MPDSIIPIEPSSPPKSTTSSVIIHELRKVASTLEALNFNPIVSIRDEEFLEQFAKLEVMLNHLFAVEEEVMRQMGVPEYEWLKHSNEHSRLLSILQDVYTESMMGKKRSAADVYLILKAELAEHVGQQDTRVFYQ